MLKSIHKQMGIMAIWLNIIKPNTTSGIVLYSHMIEKFYLDGQDGLSLYWRDIKKEEKFSSKDSKVEAF